MTADAKTAPVRKAPEGFEYRLIVTGSGGGVRLVDVRPRLNPGQRLMDLPTHGVPDELFEKIMLRRDENQQFILRLPEYAAHLLAERAWRDCEAKPYGYLLSLSHEELDWLIAKWCSDERATA